MRLINSASVLCKTPDGKITIWDYNPDNHPITGYFQPTKTNPEVYVDETGDFAIACKKSKNGSFYNIIYLDRKE